MTETFRNRIVKTVQMRIGDIEPHPFNPRTHPQAQMDPLRGHLTETGKTRVPTAYYSERNGGRLTFTDGHGRQAINPDEIWTIAITDLTDAEADLDLAVGDPLAALAGTDAAKLDDLLRDVSTSDAALQAMLGELAEAAGIGAGVEPGAGGDEFDTTPDDGPTRAQPGDLWVIGGVHRLLVGDCTDAANVARLMDGERADAVITDPPYGIDASRMTMGSGESAKPKSARLSNVKQWDRSRPDVMPLLGMADRVCIWGGNYFADVLPVTNDWLCWWKKNDNLSFSEFELAWTNYGGNARHFAHHWSGEEKQHITQKPLPVMEWCVSFCLDGALIYDPFLGSGTTLIAAHRTGRRCYGMEIECRYADVILRRAEAENLTVELIERLEHQDALNVV